jgi:hypothetical protein
MLPKGSTVVNMILPVSGSGNSRYEVKTITAGCGSVACSMIEIEDSYQRGFDRHPQEWSLLEFARVP